VRGRVGDGFGELYRWPAYTEYLDVVLPMTTIRSSRLCSSKISRFVRKGEARNSCVSTHLTIDVTFHITRRGEGIMFRSTLGYWPVPPAPISAGLVEGLGGRFSGRAAHAGHEWRALSWLRVLV